MIRFIASATLLAALLTTGCSSYVETEAGQRVEISGTLTGPDGKPMKDVGLQFFAMGGLAQQVVLPVDSNGKFKGEVVVGKYSFYCTEQYGTGAAKSRAALAKVADKYKEASESRTVEIKEAGVYDLKFE